MIRSYFKLDLLRNFGIYTIANIINKLVPFILLPILTRYLSTEEYGKISMVTVVLAWIVPFISLNIEGAIKRQYYNKDEIDISAYIGNSILIVFFSTIIVSVVLYFFEPLIVNLTSLPTSIIWKIIAIAFFQFFVSITMILFQVQNQSLTYGLFNIGKTTSEAVLSIVLVVIVGLGWQGRIISQLVALGVFSVIALIYMIKNKWISIVFNMNYIKNALAFGIPLIPHALSGTVITLADRLFITKMVSIEATGVYTVGYQIGSIINVLAVSFNTAYVPWLYEKLKKDSEKSKIGMVKLTYIYFITIILIAAALGVISPYLMKYIVGSTYYGASIYVMWIAMGYAFKGMYLMIVNYIFYIQQTKYLAVVTFVTAILNIVMNYYLINLNGSIGAAQSTLISYVVKFILTWMLVAKLYKMPWLLNETK